MNRTVKTIAYLVLITAACLLGVRTLAVYRSLMRPASQEETEPIERHEEAEGRAGAGATNAPARTNLLSATNIAALTTVTQAALAPTNLPPVPTGSVGSASASTGAVETAAADAKAPQRPSFGSLLAHAAGLFGVCVCLSLLLANDLSQFVAHRFVTLLFNDEGEESKPPEYEKAEQAAMDGQPLEAVRMMRDYFKKHPRKVYVAMRIAEIYEKDLGNYLAAALEYEEILKYRLRPEQWGQTAIHLANLYSGKLGKPEKAVELLRKIAADYGETAAAAKARSRLAQLDGQSVEVVEAPAPEPLPAPREEPPSNLPKGFRPK